MTLDQKIVTLILVSPLLAAEMSVAVVVIVWAARACVDIWKGRYF